MREIKFRAWHVDTQQMLPNAQTGVIRTFTENGSYLVKECKYMQYTGLKDKNGVAEVYEGDIIDIYGNIKGNIYQMDKGQDDLVIQGFGTKSWEATNKKAMERGLKYSE